MDGSNKHRGIARGILADVAIHPELLWLKDDVIYSRALLDSGFGCYWIFVVYGNVIWSEYYKNAAQYKVYKGKHISR